LSSFVFFIILGLITSITLIVKVEEKSNDIFANSASQIKIQKLKSQIEAIESQNNNLESQMLILNFNLTKLLENREKYDLLRLSALTGTHNSIGEGLLIKLNDSDKPLKRGENPNFGIVHNTDLLNIIDYLWSGGARAISVNDIRIVNTADISCIGPTLLINKTRVVPPFIIKAIGNPDNLEKALNNSNIQALDLYGIKFSVDRYDKLEVPANGTIILAGDK